MGKMYSGRLWISKRLIIRAIGVACDMVRVYGIGGILLKAVQSLYVDSRACVRMGNDVSWWIPLNVGLRKGCVMSPWLF